MDVGWALVGVVVIIFAAVVALTAVVVRRRAKPAAADEALTDWPDSTGTGRRTSRRSTYADHQRRLPSRKLRK
jgi:hypothetical protein